MFGRIGGKGGAKIGAHLSARSVDIVEEIPQTWGLWKTWFCPQNAEACPINLQSKQGPGDDPIRPAPDYRISRIAILNMLG